MNIEASAKLVISAIFAVFMGYNPRFMVSGGFRCTVTPRDTTIQASAKLVISAIFDVFMGYNPRFMVSGGSRCTVTPFTRLSRHRQNSLFRPFLTFSWVIALDLWSGEDFDALCPRDTTVQASAELVISAIFDVFMGCNPRFMVSGGFRCTVTPGTQLSRHRQKS